MNKFLSIITFVFVLICFPIITKAEDKANTWRWYYTSFYSPKDTKVLLRSGTANVKIADKAIDINFIEGGLEGQKSKFVGKINKGDIVGELINFFPSGNDYMKGTYKERKIPNCRFSQISIYPEYPDGEILMLSKIDGLCQ